MDKEICTALELKSDFKYTYFANLGNELSTRICI